jgi:NDP-sugar pyrophosphorylase family protein
VAPAYIGCRSKIREDAVITRSSNIERDCFIDSATVIDNSSVLPNTHIGICLDVCNAVVEKNKFLSLDRGVTIAISESRVMRSTGAGREKAAGLGAAGLWRKSPTACEVGLPLRGAWQFGTNLFQE